MAAYVSQKERLLHCAPLILPRNFHSVSIAHTEDDQWQTMEERFLWSGQLKRPTVLAVLLGIGGTGYRPHLPSLGTSTVTLSDQLFYALHYPANVSYQPCVHTLRNEE